MSRAMISYWESGTRAPNDRQLVAMARLYGEEVRRLSPLVNLEMTPERRRFHELAHALFHSDEKYVLSFAQKGRRERFAASFGGEFLMPSEGLRRMMEEHGFGPHITDPADIIHLQRAYNVCTRRPSRVSRTLQPTCARTER